MSSEAESDIEIQSALPKVSNKKMPKSPSEDILRKKQDPKKITTKIMINQALIDLKSRKGTSLYAIKKYITEKYSVDTEKLNYHIKKYIKSAVEEGSIVQTKGIGASGSFKLVPVKEKKKKVKNIDKEKISKKEKAKDPEKIKKIKEKKKPSSKKPGKSEKIVKSKEVKMSKPEDKPKKTKKKMDKDAKPKTKSGDEENGIKKKKVTMKTMKTPAKKKASMMKRKSIGSIIKPPKMKPKAKA